MCEPLFFTDDETVVDLIANQLKFIACLKILAEELSTLAAGAEVSTVSHLSQHFCLAYVARPFIKFLLMNQLIPNLHKVV